MAVECVKTCFFWDKIIRKHENTGVNNRWKMRHYPIGTGAHCDRFVQWFYDAVAVLAEHEKRPTIPYEVYLR